MQFFNHVDTTNDPPLDPPPNNGWMKKPFYDRVKCLGLHKLQHCLGARGKGGEIKADHVNCPKSFFSQCR